MWKDFLGGEGEGAASALQTADAGCRPDEVERKNLHLQMCSAKITADLTRFLEDPAVLALAHAPYSALLWSGLPNDLIVH